jgi:hypothetical protein
MMRDDLLLSPSKTNFLLASEAISHHFQHFFSISVAVLVLVVALAWLVGCCLINSFDFQLIFIPSSRFTIRTVSEMAREKLAIFNLSQKTAER